MTNSNFKLDRSVKRQMALMYDKSKSNQYKKLMIYAQLEAAKPPPVIKENKK